MTDLWLTYSETSYGGEMLDSTDRWSSRTDEHREFYPSQVYFSQEDVPGWLRETFLVDGDVDRGDVVYLVVVRYSTGDTFGHSTGHWHLEGGYLDPKEATKVIEAIRSDDESDRDRRRPGGRLVGNARAYKGEYLPWVGYFESLENVELHTMVVT